MLPRLEAGIAVQVYAGVQNRASRSWPSKKVQCHRNSSVTETRPETLLPFDLTCSGVHPNIEPLTNTYRLIVIPEDKILIAMGANLLRRIGHP